MNNKELAQAVLNYLAKQPYQEVFLLINAIQESYKVTPESEVKKTTEETPKE